MRHDHMITVAHSQSTDPVQQEGRKSEENERLREPEYNFILDGIQGNLQS